MAIRFHCTMCGQPIEIDDEWAAKHVACPFCRNTIIAPLTSTIEPEPVAEEAPAGGAVDVTVSDSRAALPAEPARNATALIAIILACMTIGLFIVLSVIAYQHKAELMAFQKEIQTLVRESGSYMGAVTQYMNQHGGQFPVWMMLFSGLQLGMLASAITGLICAVLALRKHGRRGLAIASLVICSVAILAMCGGALG